MLRRLQRLCIQGDNDRRNGRACYQCPAMKWIIGIVGVAGLAALVVYLMAASMVLALTLAGVGFLSLIAWMIHD